MPKDLDEKLAVEEESTEPEAYQGVAEGDPSVQPPLKGEGDREAAPGLNPTPLADEAPTEDDEEDGGERRPIDISSLKGLRGDGIARWYVVHTYSGHENKVKVNIEKMVENRGMQDLILQVVVPTEERIEVKNGERKLKTRKMFPGYVIVKMIVTNETWYLVRNTQGVTGFVGHGSDPVPLSDAEVRRMGIEKINIDLDVEVGDTVKVINGPFENFMGEILEINMEKQTMRVLISMFGRDTPVELEFAQVDKI